MQDMGFANNGQISTPTFNHLHDNGVALEQYYVQPSCSPTRATFMTGASHTLWRARAGQEIGHT